MAENTTFVNLIVLFILLAGAHLAMEGPTSFKVHPSPPPPSIAAHVFH